VEGLGWGFWLKLIGGVILVGLAFFVILLVLDLAYAAWGALGAMVFFIGVTLLFAYLYDKRQQRRRVGP
jgi:multisubunit Na+/H+ antiporter MnhB subunit